MQLKHGIMPQGTLFVPLYGTRFRHSPLVGMNLSVAIGVYKNAVLFPVASTLRFVVDVVVMPARIFRDWLVAVRADAFLFLPKLQ